MKDRGYATDEHGFKFNLGTFTVEDGKEFDTTLTTVPCRHRDLHITSALIPQGAVRPATKTHRVNVRVLA